MARRIILYYFLFLTATNAQFYDFFQGFQPYYNNFQTTAKPHVYNNNFYSSYPTHSVNNKPSIITESVNTNRRPTEKSITLSFNIPPNNGHNRNKSRNRTDNYNDKTQYGLTTEDDNVNRKNKRVNTNNNGRNNNNTNKRRPHVTTEASKNRKVSGNSNNRRVNTNNNDNGELPFSFNSFTSTTKKPSYETPTNNDRKNSGRPSNNDRTFDSRKTTNLYRSTSTTKKPTYYGNSDFAFTEEPKNPYARPTPNDRPSSNNRPVTTTTSSYYDRPSNNNNNRPFNTGVSSFYDRPSNDDRYTEKPSYNNDRYTEKPYYNNERPINNNARPINNYDRPLNTNDNSYDRPTNNYDRPLNTNDNSYDRPTNSYDRPTNNYDRPTNNNNRPINNNNRPTNNNNRPSEYTPPITNRPNTNFGRTEEPEVISGPDVDFMTASEKRKYMLLADKMCERYQSLSENRISAIPLLPSPDPVSVTVKTCPPSKVPLVLGGSPATIEQFPHMAAIGWNKMQGKGYGWKCGGSLISERHVLTAAHCSYQERDQDVVTGPPRVVQLGSAILNHHTAIIIAVAAAIRHPKYKQPSSYYDIAVLKLKNDVKFSDRIKPACLGEPPSPGEPVIATGWGKYEQGDQAEQLRSVSVPIWDIRSCQEALGQSPTRKLPQGPLPDAQVCAGEEAGGKDTCQGDSGGPLQTQAGCIWRVVAVTSLGRACAAPRTPGVYAKVHTLFIAAAVAKN